jgi:hypothetical protein
MHTHVLGPEDPVGDLDLMLANGITGSRQMGANAELLRQWRDGELPDSDSRPELLAMPGAVLIPLNAPTDEAAVATVRQQKAAGADFIKVGFVTPSAVFAAQAEAVRLGVPILGHLPTGVDVWSMSGRPRVEACDRLSILGLVSACWPPVRIVRRQSSICWPMRLRSSSPPLRVP